MFTFRGEEFNEKARYTPVFRLFGVAFHEINSRYEDAEGEERYLGAFIPTVNHDKLVMEFYSALYQAKLKAEGYPFDEKV